MKSKSLGILLVVSCAVGAALAGCSGGDDDPGISCGEGTVQRDKQCVASTTGTAGSGGSAGSTAGTGGAQAGKAGAGGSVQAGAGGAGAGGAGAGGAGGAAGQAGSGGSAGKASANVAPTFAGVTAVAPISATGLFVAWAPATDDVSATNKISYNVYVGTIAGGQAFGVPTATSAPGATSVEINSGLSPDTTYFVVVRAVDEAGNEDKNTKEKSGGTKADTTAPTFAGATAAAPAGAGAVKLTWAAGTDDLTPPEGLVYYAYWADSTGGQAFDVPAGVSEPGATSVEVSGLPAPDATYFFVVRARDAAGNLDANKKEVSAKSGPDTTAPTFSGCATATAKDAGSVSVTWKPASDDTTLAKDMKIHVYASSMSGGHDFTTPQASFVGGTQGVVTGLKSSTNYFFVCRAADTSGNEDKNKLERSAKTLDDSSPPTFKGVTTISNITVTSLDLAWDAATDDKTAQAEIVYDVYQAATAGTQDFTKPTVTSAPGATKITISNLASATSFFFVVRARDKAGNRDTNAIEKFDATFVSLKTNVQPIFTDSCATDGCHSNNNPQNMMTLTKGFAFGSIVGVPVVEKGGEVRVVAGDPNASYLYKKVIGASDIVGSPMPLSPVAPLVTAQKELIRLWILQGAQNN